jgi:predicted nucleic acid-binding protein
MAQFIVRNVDDDIHSLGRPVEIRDVQIAGIVSVRNATLVTRNLEHFQEVAITFVSPWN